jgi:4-alpha-glucanotransferase
MSSVRSPVATLGERTSGVLLHPTSLPGPFGSGDIGPAARVFVDWLAAAGQTFWQMLPIVPPGFNASPYDSPSSFAGSPWLVSPRDLAEDGLLDEDALAAPAPRQSLLESAFERFRQRNAAADRRDLEQLRSEHGSWLEAWTLFSALRADHGDQVWTAWPETFRRREPAALREARRKYADEIAFHEFVQLAFDRQWRRLREHCRSRNVALLGDVPMFVAHDSADVWKNPELFQLDDAGASTVVAGVPPDAFSTTGQLWGNPVYRWARMQKQDFSWWTERLGLTLARFDAVRLDHFIGFRRYWEIPADAGDARAGHYVDVPGEAFFDAVRGALGGLPFVAEDLGMVTPEVEALRDRYELPGMRVLEFAFGSDESNDYRPHRFVKNAVVYTGTHDNDTVVGWWQHASKAERERVQRYFGCDGRDIHWTLIRGALASVANAAIFPLQDALGVGSSGRMNTPGTVDGNWRWRVEAAALGPALAERLRTLCHDYERTPRPHSGDAESFARGPAL